MKLEALGNQGLIHTHYVARLAKVHVTTIVRLEAFEAQQVRGPSGTIIAVGLS